jgi:hypothetical protein
MKADCQKDLDAAMPIYKKALAALETLDKNGIIEMKGYNNPAEEIILVANAVQLLFGQAETWDAAK